MNTTPQERAFTARLIEQCVSAGVEWTRVPVLHLSRLLADADDDSLMNNKQDSPAIRVLNVAIERAETEMERQRDIIVRMAMQGVVTRLREIRREIRAAERENAE